jgi:glucose-6-phosphate isomerase
VDYSKNRINEEVKSTLTRLAEECKLKEAIDAYYGGGRINRTEGREVLHTALRAPKVQ